MKKNKMSRTDLFNNKWHIVDDRLAYRIIKKEENKNFKRVYSFDLDNTLILSKGYFKPAQHEKDYIFYSDNVSSFLQKKYEEGYKIIIFSNQKGVTTGKISLLNILNRVEDILIKLNVPIECYLALKNDKYRKPRIEMFNFMKAHNNNNQPIEEIIYVGDLANRIYNENFKKNFLHHLKYIYSKNKIKINITRIQERLIKDYRDTDLKFALNLNAKFFTPEEIFLNIKHTVPTTFPFEPQKLDRLGKPETKKIQQLKENVTEEKEVEIYTEEKVGENIKVKEKEEETQTTERIEKEEKSKKTDTTETKEKKKIIKKVIILIGAPGCGKTSFSNNYFPNCVKISLKLFKDKKDALEVLKNSLANFQNVVIDSENGTMLERKLHIDAIKKMKNDIKIEAVYFNYSKDLILHLNTFKLLTDEMNYTDIPTTAIQSFYKNVEEPSLQEGLDHITILHDEDFTPQNFLNEEQQRLFFMYLN